MSRLLLIRHGQASFGAENYDKLSSLGELQAQRLGECLAATGLQFDAIYSGDLQRQRRTGELCLAAMMAGKGEQNTCVHHIDPRFNEVDNEGQLEALLPEVLASRPDLADMLEQGIGSSKQYQKILEAVFKLWVSGEAQAKQPSLQSWEAYSADAYAALDEVMAANSGGKTVAVFCSGGTIATLVARLAGVARNDGAGVYQYYEPVRNCSVSEVFYSGSVDSVKASLSSFNDTGVLALAGAQRGESLLSYR